MTTSTAPVGVFDLFTIGIGPSSSHTVGPMKAAAAFAKDLRRAGTADSVESVRVEIFGSLAATGHGHGTFTAVLLGLDGAQSARIDSGEVERRLADITASGTVSLGAGRRIPCRIEDFVLRPLTVRPRHTNALTFTAYGHAGVVVRSDTYYSVGGGFVVRHGDEEHPSGVRSTSVPHPFRTAAELLAVCDRTGSRICDVIRDNELAGRSHTDLSQGLRELWDTMQTCVTSAVSRTGVLPGGLGVRRRAGAWASRLEREDPEHSERYWQERVNFIALAVNEENAGGGRVVTAPTNGAAGIIPAVLFYALHYTAAGKGADEDSRNDIVERFLLTATAVGSLCKTNASISGAEVGCQGEVGSASAMAAAGLAEILGGTPRQVENAAEIALEHNLGLTCDPVAGLVQVPCIERNAIAAVKAINAARMALWGDGNHHVSLDQVIATMRETGADMSHKYKETALGGLAVNLVEC
ncbi:L-serine ammonia-lyase [Streptomyces sp. NRRL F-5135]|uniref:L-serine ammonia-lyase n=1 Tax=Streptomyces sp. NRRL F-5135 TaxID=1463858 RepID=UPI0004CB41E8|nr:L-serine ammonia-lyase [Streptomyces sp. NRRL F-5135]